MRRRALLFDGPANGFLDGAEWLAISPGVPMRSPVVLEAKRRGVPVLAEIEIAWRIAERRRKDGTAGSR